MRLIEDTREAEVRAVFTIDFTPAVEYVALLLKDGFNLSIQEVSQSRREQRKLPLPRTVMHGVAEISSFVFMENDPREMAALFVMDYLEYYISRFVVSYDRKHVSLEDMAVYVKDEYVPYMTESGNNSICSNLAWIETALNKRIFEICEMAKISSPDYATYYIRRQGITANSSFLIVEIREDYRILDWELNKQKEIRNASESED